MTLLSIHCNMSFVDIYKYFTFTLDKIFLAI